jgi:hypothetical protein
MPDPLLTRAQLVIEDTRRLHDRRRALKEQGQKQLTELRIALLECAMTRVEIRAYREDRVRPPAVDGLFHILATPWLNGNG